MGIFRKIGSGFKKLVKWVYKNPETVVSLTQAGKTIYDARQQRKTYSKTTGDYTLANLRESIHQLEDTLAEEITAVRNDISRVFNDLQTDYTNKFDELSAKVEELTELQKLQTLVIKRTVISFSVVAALLAAAVVVLFIL